jgi:hypothetical protein
VIAVVALAVLGSCGAQSARLTDAASTPVPVASNERMVLTYYFYWYDALTGGHLDDNAGLRDQLPATPAPNWRSVDWHKRQLSDMRAAGIDVALPVYWGYDGPDGDWSSKGLDTLARAWTGLQADGERPPHIGMFLDTTIVQMRDLTSSDGKDYFYSLFRDFFRRIPRQQWALVNGRPVAFLFTSDFTGAVNQSTFDYVYARFEAEFGVRPYIVREVSWDYPILRWEGGQRVRDYAQPIETDNSYLWGAAVHGFVDVGGVAAVGPGYDDRRVPGRGGTVTDREGGSFYRRNFEAATASGKPLLVIETWNEIHEGTSIAETLEYGRAYIEATRALAAAFRAFRPLTSTSEG